MSQRDLTIGQVAALKAATERQMADAFMDFVDATGLLPTRIELEWLTDEKGRKGLVKVDITLEFPKTPPQERVRFKPLTGLVLLACLLAGCGRQAPEREAAAQDTVFIAADTVYLPADTLYIPAKVVYVHADTVYIPADTLFIEEPSGIYIDTANVPAGFFWRQAPSKYHPSR